MFACVLTHARVRASFCSKPIVCVCVCVRGNHTVRPYMDGLLLNQQRQWARKRDREKEKVCEAGIFNTLIQKIGGEESFFSMCFIDLREKLLMMKIVAFRY